MNNVITIFIFLLIILILSAILISYNLIIINYESMGNHILDNNKIKGGNNEIGPNSLYTILMNEQENIAVSLCCLSKDSNILDMILYATPNSCKSHKIKCLVYGSSGILVKSVYNICNLLQELKNANKLNDDIIIILIDNMLSVKSKKEIDINLLASQVNMKILHTSDDKSTHFLISNDGNIENTSVSLMRELLEKWTTDNKWADNDNSNISLMKKLMDIFSSTNILWSKDNAVIAQGGNSNNYTIPLNNKFITNFRSVIKNKYNQELENSNELPPEENNFLSPHDKFMTALIENNRNVEIVTERPHTENMEHGKLYFLPNKKMHLINLEEIFAKIGTTDEDKHSMSVPIGEYFIGSSENSFKIE